jgi:hypothetical protein
MSMYKTFATSNAIPWRLRQGLEHWVESSCRDRRPSLYRWLHFGDARDRLRAVTSGPAHHFFGFNDRPPGAADSVAIGIVDVENGHRFQPLAATRAWNWQQGSMLQWHPGDPDKLIVHNDLRSGRFVAVVRDTAGHEVAVYDRPVYAMAPQGRHAYSVNFARLHRHRPGYGYAGAEDAYGDDPHPSDDGLHRIDLGSGRSELIVPIDALGRIGTKEPITDFPWRARLFTCADDGSEPACLIDADVVSHYDWLDARTLLIWARDQGTPGHFWRVDALTGERAAIGRGILIEDGHVSFSPDRRWVLNDTYPDRHDMRTLMLYRWADGERIDLARLHSPKARWWGEIRCDLHPRWNRDGTKICIDSVHSGERQMYVMDVARLVA